MKWMNSGAKHRLVLLLIGSSLMACSTPQVEKEARKEAVGSLQEGVAARVGEEVVSIEQVRQLVQATSISPEEARTRLIYDALMAVGARETGHHAREEVLVQRRSVLARAIIESMRQEVLAAPITEEEVRTYTERHWLDMDRPVARKTMHAVVMPKDGENEGEWAKADEIAARIAEAVRGETDPEEFKKKAEAVEAQGMKVLVQPLPPVTQDGRVADLKNRPPPGHPPQTFDEAFVKAVFALPSEGAQSGPTRSPFGTHVILLESIQPELRVEYEKRRSMLAEEIRAGRMRERLETLTSELKKARPVTVERNAEAMLQLVEVEPSGTEL